MSDWGWVTFAYVVVYGTLGAYVLSLGARIQRTKRQSHPR